MTENKKNDGALLPSESARILSIKPEDSASEAYQYPPDVDGLLSYVRFIYSRTAIYGIVLVPGLLYYWLYFQATIRSICL